MSGVQLIAFSTRGYVLAQKLAVALHGAAMRCGAPLSLQQWTEQAFQEASALIFIGAAGIAVRAIAPYVQSKTTDPAVVVLDECAQFAIPILSGHFGGANDLARRIAAFCGACPVITTATDVRGVFAVDEWARHHGCAVVHPERIRLVSAKLLAKQPVQVRTDFPIRGKLPVGLELTDKVPCDFEISLSPRCTTALHLIPQIGVLGIGCKKGSTVSAIETAFSDFLLQNKFSAQAISAVHSIDLKREEAGLIEFCQNHELPFTTFSGAALAAVPGEFSGSEFVRCVTGVDNVCERSAVLGSGGSLVIPKTVIHGVTLALACRPFDPDWRWQNA